jgi:hypothetical protein
MCVTVLKTIAATLLLILKLTAESILTLAKIIKLTLTVLILV